LSQYTAENVANLFPQQKQELISKVLKDGTLFDNIDSLKELGVLEELCKDDPKLKMLYESDCSVKWDLILN
jgi:hypothetical protein